MSERGAPAVARSFIFKAMESFSVQIIGFIVYVVLARILDPSDYGILTMLSIFITVSQVFVQSGLNTALIQKREITEADRSSVFYVSLAVAAALYGVLYLCAPAIGEYFRMPALAPAMRVLALTLFPGALVSVQQAVAAREMRFKRLMISTLISTLVSGAVGIAMAYRGMGHWSLVGQQLSSQLCLAIALFITIRWRPHAVFSLTSVATLITFGWKLLVSSLIDTLYNNLRGLVIGRKYDAATLGVYDKGKKFPELVMNVVNGSIQSVMLPVLSRDQDRVVRLRYKMRRSIMVSAYMVFPLMAGLMIIARPLVSVVLTDKWLPCVPFLQVCCIDFAFYPIHTANLQAINALGRSDLFLKLELVKKSYGILILCVSVFCFDSALAIAAGGAVSTLISAFVNASPNKRLLGYGYLSQMRDVIPPLVLSLVMAFAASLVTLSGLTALPLLLAQIAVGAGTYIVLSLIFKPEGFVYMKETLAALIGRGGEGR